MMGLLTDVSLYLMIVSPVDYPVKPYGVQLCSRAFTSTVLLTKDQELGLGRFSLVSSLCEVMDYHHGSSVVTAPVAHLLS